MSEDKKEVFVDEYGEVEQKLLILYLIDSMEIPLSYNQISEFILEVGYMDYITLITCLGNMEEADYLNKTVEGTSNRYDITETGKEALEFFGKRIPVAVKNRIKQYIIENKNYIRRDYEIIANYFEEALDDGRYEYIVKCGTYENDTMLMELNISVVSKEQAKLICNNWKNNVSSIYTNIIKEITQK